MKKFIKLLNEWLKYEEKHGPDKLTRVVGIDDSCELVFNLENGCYWKAEYVISKRCGFIKWLVDNDKIDTNNLSLKAFKNIFSGGGFVEVSDLKVLLMLLSISDTPIEDLLLYLK